MALIKVKDDLSIARDLSSGGIVAIDNEAYDAHLRAKSRKQDIEKRISTIEKDVSDIKEMFAEILRKIDK